MRAYIATPDFIHSRTSWVSINRICPCVICLEFNVSILAHVADASTRFAQLSFDFNLSGSYSHSLPLDAFL